MIHKILTTVTPTPVALLDPATITAATSTPGLSITSAGWFDASGNSVKSAFNPETYKIPKLMFYMYLYGYSTQQIADYLILLRIKIYLFSLE